MLTQDVIHCFLRTETTANSSEVASQVALGQQTVGSLEPWGPGWVRAQGHVDIALPAPGPGPLLGQHGAPTPMSGGVEKGKNRDSVPPHPALCSAPVTRTSDDTGVRGGTCVYSRVCADPVCMRQCAQQYMCACGAVPQRHTSTCCLTVTVTLLLFPGLGPGRPVAHFPTWQRKGCGVPGSQAVPLQGVRNQSWRKAVCPHWQVTAAMSTSSRVAGAQCP